MRIRLVISLSAAFKFIAAQVISTVAGTGTAGYSGDNGSAILSELNQPTGINFDLQGAYYISDAINSVIRKVNLLDTIVTIAGTGSFTYNGDSIPSLTANICPINAAPDNSGNIYVSDQCNSRIRMVNSWGLISTIAGTGNPGYSGDSGPATQAQVRGPAVVMINSQGEIIFTDFTAHCVRKIDAAGIITTIAGTGTAGFSGDNGLALNAQLNGPVGIVEDSSGNYYIADQLNNRIRKIDKNGIISTVAGAGTQGYSGDNGPATIAQLNNPAIITADDAGNLFIADYLNSVIRKIDLTGIITTIAGTGVQGYSGDNGLANSAQLKYPCGIALNKNGDLFISDEGNHVIRKVTNAGVMSVKKNSRFEKTSLQVFPNPSNGKFTLTMSATAETPTVEILNTLGESVYKNISTHFPYAIDVSFLPPGVYYLKAASNEKTFGTQRVVISK